MNNQERSDMRKIFILLSMYLLCIPKVFANTNTDITNDVLIKFKWYHDEVTEGFYYPKKDKLSDYFEDATNIEYGEYSDWGRDYCNYSNEYYFIESKNAISYEKIVKIMYIKIQTSDVLTASENRINYFKILSTNKEINYTVVSNNYSGITIKLSEEYDPDELIFYIDSDYTYKIFLSTSLTIYPIILYSPTTNQKLITPNESWKVNTQMYTNEISDLYISKSPFIKNIEMRPVCRVKEIKTYRYKTKKEYYDDKYYSNVEGYTPDVFQYNVTYLKEFPEKTVEVVKEVPIVRDSKEYIYVTDDEKRELDNNNKESLENEKIIYKTEYVDKIVNKIPVKKYILIIFLIILIILELIKIISKKVD